MIKVGDMVYWEGKELGVEAYRMGKVIGDSGYFFDVRIGSDGAHCYPQKENVRKLPATGSRVKLKKPTNERGYPVWVNELSEEEVYAVCGILLNKQVIAVQGMPKRRSGRDTWLASPLWLVEVACSETIVITGCAHPNKRQVTYKPGDFYYYCPDCKEGVKI